LISFRLVVVDNAEMDRVLALTLTEAAAATGVHRREIDRLLKADAFPSAHRHGDTWVIPIRDLEPAGLKVDREWLKRARQFRRSHPIDRHCADCDAVTTAK
jgi:predicted DNA-binding transcriptional regulator AlpA